MAINYEKYFDMAVGKIKMDIELGKAYLKRKIPEENLEIKFGNSWYSYFIVFKLLDFIVKFTGDNQLLTDDRTANASIPFYYDTGDGEEKNYGKFERIPMYYRGAHHFIERLKNFCKENGLEYKENPLDCNNGMGPHFEILFNDMSIAKLREIYLSEIKKLQDEGLTPPSDYQDNVSHQVK